MLTDTPGKTDLLECAIDLVDEEPFRIKAYPVPCSLKQDIDKEVGEMLRANIIEPSL